MRLNLKLLAIALAIIGVSLPNYAQTLAEKIAGESTIYVSPLNYYKYYGVKSGAGLGTVPYSYNGSFNIGDMVSVTDPNYSYELVGEVNEELISTINQQIISRFAEKWGENKFKPWPENMINQIGNYDQKNIESDIYIIIQRAAWQEPLRLISVSSSNPDVKSQIKGGTENIKITIYERLKAGKKGKKVASVMINPFTDLVQEYSGEDQRSEAGAEFVQKANAELQNKIDELLDQLFSEIQSNL